VVLVQEWCGFARQVIERRGDRWHTQKLEHANGNDMV
jgi:hypothetical protein